MFPHGGTGLASRYSATCWNMETAGQQFPAIKKARENGGDCGGVFVNPGGGQTIST